MALTSVSLYRQPGRPAARTLAVVAVAALLVGGGAGYAIGAAGGSDRPTLSAAVASLRSALDPVRDAMELVPTEYRQAVKAGRVAAPTEYAAAKADVQRASEAVRRHRSDLQTLYPRTAALLDNLLAQLSDAVRRRANEQVVARLARAVRTTLAAAFPRGPGLPNGVVVVP